MNCSDFFGPQTSLHQPVFGSILAFNEANLTKEKYMWSESIFISLTSYLTICYIFYFYRLNYDDRITKNKCTLIPFLFNTASLLALNIKFITDPFFNFPCILANRVFQYVTGSAACVFFLVAVCVQIYEWDILRFQICFQKPLRL